MPFPSLLPAVVFLTISLTTTLAQSNPILTASFTWNPHCGPTVACGPSAAGFHGTGFAASNNLTYAGCTNNGGSVDCSGASIVSGVGKGCGQCWHIMPTGDSFPTNGHSAGTSVVVKINDQCTDPGYCDQTEAHPVNTGYGKDIHIDLCADSGVATQFFGALGPGVVTGLAQLTDCSALNDGPYGSGLGNLDGSSSSGSSSSPSAGGDPSSTPSNSVSPNSGSDLSNLNTKLAKQKLSSGHDGQKAVAQVAGGSSDGASSGASNAGSNNGGVSSSSSVTPSSSPMPTTLVAVVSSSSAPAPVSSSLTGGTGDDDEEEEGAEDCNYGDSGEL